MYLSIEADFLNSIAEGLIKSPLQLNGLLESDAEIFKINPNDKDSFVLKVDTIHEEIQSKLYTDPFLIGWMGITAPISDLAAVGAMPIGVVLSLILPSNLDQKWLKEFKSGINSACQTYKIYVLGGDTNQDNIISVSVTAIGKMNEKTPRQRKTIQENDYLFSSGPLGQGNAFAYQQLFEHSNPTGFLPKAKIEESQLIYPFAACCIDTSDGLFPALSVLAEVNQIGFQLEGPVRNFLNLQTKQLAKSSKLQDWFFLAGPHGEYELVFSVPENSIDNFRISCKKNLFKPIYLGKAIKEQKIRYKSNEKNIECRPADIPNLFHQSEGNLSRYLELLLEAHSNWTSP